MNINELSATPQKMAEIIMQDDEFIFTSWGRKSTEGLAEMIAQAPDPLLLELAKLGLELAEEINQTWDAGEWMNFSRKHRIVNAARTLREKAGV